MLIWFAVMSVAGVVLVFRDPFLDHRLVALGALLPDAVDLVVRRGDVGPSHSLVGVVAFLTAVMLGTIGRRKLRKRLLALPIGAMAHLALDGVWTRTKVFAWPVTGWTLPGRLFTLSRPLALNLAMEAVGVAVAVVMYRRCGLDRPARRQAFLHQGALELLPATRGARR
jgi:hypothetical protein